MQGRELVAAGDAVRTVVVLAAGMGTRLGGLTWDRPKCLVRVGGTPIIERLLVILDAYGIDRVVIVTGYRAGMIRDALGEAFGGIAIEYVVNPLFATTNTLYSLWLVRDLVDEPLLVVEGDVIFGDDLLAPLLRPDRIAVSRQLPWMNGTTLTLDADGYVDALYSPPPGVYFQHCTSPAHLMTVNMTSLDGDTWRGVAQRLDLSVAAGHTGNFHDVVFADMIEEGSMTLQAVLFPEERWYEVDTPEDLRGAELVLARMPRASKGAGTPLLGGLT
jgi:choline kinase